MRRIAVVGSTGAGKTTMARALCRRLGVPHVELDALHWEPHWTEAQDDVFRARLAAALDEADASADGWTTDGNYKQVRPLLWARADTVVWLDYPLPVILNRLLRRTVRRTLTQEELWSGNRERLVGAFFTRDSILWWAITTYQRRRRDYPVLLARPEHAHLRVVHLRAPREADRWLLAGVLPPFSTRD